MRKKEPADRLPARLVGRRIGGEVAGKGRHMVCRTRAAGAVTLAFILPLSSRMFAERL